MARQKYSRLIIVVGRERRFPEQISKHVVWVSLSDWFVSVIRLRSPSCISYHDSTQQHCVVRAQFHIAQYADRGQYGKSIIATDIDIYTTCDRMVVLRFDWSVISLFDFHDQCPWDYEHFWQLAPFTARKASSLRTIMPVTFRHLIGHTKPPRKRVSKPYIRTSILTSQPLAPAFPSASVIVYKSCSDRYWSSICHTSKSSFWINHKHACLQSHESSPAWRGYWSCQWTKLSICRPPEE